MESEESLNHGRLRHMMCHGIMQIFDAIGMARKCDALPEEERSRLGHANAQMKEVLEALKLLVGYAELRFGEIQLQSFLSSVLGQFVQEFLEDRNHVAPLLQLLGKEEVPLWSTNTGGLETFLQQNIAIEVTPSELCWVSDQLLLHKAVMGALYPHMFVHDWAQGPRVITIGQENGNLVVMVPSILGERAWISDEIRRIHAEGQDISEWFFMPSETWHSNYLKFVVEKLKGTVEARYDRSTNIFSLNFTLPKPS